MKKPLPDINLVGASFAIKANFYTAKMYIIIGNILNHLKNTHLNIL